MIDKSWSIASLIASTGWILFMTDTDGACYRLTIWRWSSVSSLELETHKALNVRVRSPIERKIGFDERKLNKTWRKLVHHCQNRISWSSMVGLVRTEVDRQHYQTLWNYLPHLWPKGFLNIDRRISAPKTDVGSIFLPHSEFRTCDPCISATKSPRRDLICEMSQYLHYIQLKQSASWSAWHLRSLWLNHYFMTQDNRSINLRQCCQPQLRHVISRTQTQRKDLLP